MWSFQLDDQKNFHTVSTLLQDVIDGRLAMPITREKVTLSAAPAAHAEDSRELRQVNLRLLLKPVFSLGLGEHICCALEDADTRRMGDLVLKTEAELESMTRGTGLRPEWAP